MMLFCSGWNIRCYAEQNKTHCHETSSGHVLHFTEDRKWTSSLFFCGCFCHVFIKFLKHDHEDQILLDHIDTGSRNLSYNLSFYIWVDIIFFPYPPIILNIHQQRWQI